MVYLFCHNKKIKKKSTYSKITKYKKKNNSPLKCEFKEKESGHSDADFPGPLLEGQGAGLTQQAGWTLGGAVSGTHQHACCGSLGKSRSWAPSPGRGFPTFPMSQKAAHCPPPSGGLVILGPARMLTAVQTKGAHSKPSGFLQQAH